VLSKTLSDTSNTSGVGMTSMVTGLSGSLAMQNIQVIYPQPNFIPPTRVESSISETPRQFD